MVFHIRELAKLPVAVETAVSADAYISKLAEKYYQQKTFVFSHRYFHHKVFLQYLYSFHLQTRALIQTYT